MLGGASEKEFSPRIKVASSAYASASIKEGEPAPLISRKKQCGRPAVEYEIGTSD